MNFSWTTPGPKTQNSHHLCIHIQSLPHTPSQQQTCRRAGYLPLTFKMKRLPGFTNKMTHSRTNQHCTSGQQLARLLPHLLSQAYCRQLLPAVSGLLGYNPNKAVSYLLCSNSILSQSQASLSLASLLDTHLHSSSLTFFLQSGLFPDTPLYQSLTTQISKYQNL